MASRVNSIREAQHRRRPGLKLKEEVERDLSLINFYTGTVSELQDGYYLPGSRAYIETMDTTGTTRDIQVSRRGGNTFTISMLATDKIEFGRIG